MPPSVSVVLPVFNGERYLREAVDSVLAQDHPGLELIVVDDGSTDATPEIASRLPPPVRVVRQDNRGAPAARNHGLRLATGEILSFIDADDLWAEGRLRVMLDRLAGARAADIVLGRTRLVRASPASGFPRPGLACCSDPFFTLSLWSAVFRRSVFDRVGPLDESLRHSDDTDWFLRAQELGIRMATVPAVVHYYRRHDRNITNDRPVDRHYMLTALKKSLDRRRRGSGDAAPALPAWFTPVEE